MTLAGHWNYLGAFQKYWCLVSTLKNFGVTGNFRSSLGDSYAQPKLRITSLRKTDQLCFSSPAKLLLFHSGSQVSLCLSLPVPSWHFLLFPKSDPSCFAFCPFRAMLCANIYNKLLQPCSLQWCNPHMWPTGMYFWHLEHCVCETVTSQKWSWGYWGHRWRSCKATMFLLMERARLAKMLTWFGIALSEQRWSSYNVFSQGQTIIIQINSWVVPMILNQWEDF